MKDWSKDLPHVHVPNPQPVDPSATEINRPTTGINIQQIAERMVRGIRKENTPYSERQIKGGETNEN